MVLIAVVASRTSRCALDVRGARHRAVKNRKLRPSSLYLARRRTSNAS
jgi:hypothetical protein